MISTGLARTSLWERLVEQRNRLGRERGQLAPAVHQFIDGENPGAAAIGDDADPRPFERRKARDRFCRVEEFGKAIHPQDSRAPQCSVDDAVGARERSGVGRGGLRCLCVTAQA